MGIQDENTKKNMKSNNHLKSKTLRELEKFDFDWLLYSYNHPV